MNIFSKFLFIVLCMHLLACKPSYEQSKNVSIKTFNYPVLKQKQNNPILRIEVFSEQDASSVESIVVDARKSKLQDLKAVRLFYTGADSIFSENEQFGITLKPNKILDFRTTLTLNKGNNYFWLSYELSDDASLEEFVFAKLKYITLNGKKLSAGNFCEIEGLRKGVALRKHNDDNVHTFRIPGLATTNKGTLIGVYDIRRNSSVDLQEDIDVGMSRSTDGGTSWSPMKLIMDMGEWGGLPNEQNGIGDPSVLVDRKTNTIWVAGVWAHGHPGQRNWWASQPGIAPEITSQFVLVKSEDDGLTWSKPINVTNQIKQKEWYLLLQGPGKGITMNDGTLVFPAQFKDKKQIPHSTIIWSKDNGKSWTIGTGAKPNTTEAQVIELGDGSLMLNMRDDRNRTDASETNGRSVYLTKNLGETWTKHATSRTNILQESTCQASIIKDDFIIDGEKKSIILFSNPNTKNGRHSMTIKVSFDDAETWPIAHQLLIDSGNGRGYSCMTKIDDGSVGILYEGSQADITFQKLSIDEILNGNKE